MKLHAVEFFDLAEFFDQRAGEPAFVIVRNFEVVPQRLFDVVLQQRVIRFQIIVVNILDFKLIERFELTFEFAQLARKGRADCSQIVCPVILRV